jgi:uncharacterized protein (DUF433 family)
MSNIEYDKDIMGGRACLKGTRIPISIILADILSSHYGKYAIREVTDDLNLDPVQVVNALEEVALLLDERLE